MEETGTTDAFRVLARGELQLAILIETMRREGYELMVGKPEIVVKTENGRRLEPLELLVVDCPEAFIGIVMESLGTRRGELKKMVNHDSGRVRMEFSIPSRGLIGLRGQLLTDTRGTSLIHSLLERLDRLRGGHGDAARPGRWSPTVREFQWRSRFGESRNAAKCSSDRA